MIKFFMVEFFAAVGKFMAAIFGFHIGNRLGRPGIIASIFFFLWAVSDIVQLLQVFGG